jgi:hypothetical protein
MLDRLQIVDIKQSKEDASPPTLAGQVAQTDSLEHMLRSKYLAELEETVVFVNSVGSKFRLPF